jgi:hypothetical protein
VGELADTEVYQKVGKIVGQHELYQCSECALAVMQWLRDNKIEGREK